MLKDREIEVNGYVYRLKSRYPSHGVFDVYDGTDHLAIAILEEWEDEEGSGSEWYLILKGSRRRERHVRIKVALERMFPMCPKGDRDANQNHDNQ